MWVGRHKWPTAGDKVRRGSATIKRLCENVLLNDMSLVYACLVALTASVGRLVWIEMSAECLQLLLCCEHTQYANRYLNPLTLFIMVLRMGISGNNI